ncbi:MAG: tetratricopeptide repeat protein [Bacteroidales bacterium]|nr:tetratricopeptide repeat protein [Bacteroidales bacterium]
MRNIKNFAIFILAAAVLSSCGGLNKMVKDSNLVSYQVTPEVLEMHGGEVDMTVKVNYPVKYFNKKAVVTLTPVLRYEGGETTLDPLVLQGEDVTENNKPISFDNGGSASVSNTFTYEDAMMMSELYFNVNAAIKDKTADLGEVKLADGIITTPLLVKNDAKVILFDNKFKQIVPESYQADIKYVINRADVRRSEMKKDEITGLNETLQKANENERIDLKGIEISAYASPDGELDLNTKLADKRQKTATKYLSGQLKKSDIEVADELMSFLATPEDWDGFKKAMEESDIQDKEMILRVLSMHSDPVVREQEIKNLTAAFEVIAEEILPQLRRSKFTVTMDKIGWSDEELKELWTSNPDTLVLEELLYTATLVEDNETKLAVYTKAAELAPKCLRAHNNKGVVLYNQGKLEEAAAAFDAAKALKDHDIINNNIGAIALKNGDVAAAKEAFTASLGAGSKVNYNLGIVSIKEGEYETAVNYFGSDPSFNAALAMYLKGDSEGAWRTAANLEKSGMGYYLLAVIAAGQDKPDAALENLKLAVDNCEKPEKLKEHAKKNLEFAKLFETAEFKAIVE